MSSAAFAALPSTARVFEYDEDGDAIMYDASTGLPILFSAAPAPRRGSTGTLIASPLPDEEGAAAPAPPAAPKKAAVGPPGDDDGDGAESAVRNLAEAMAEAVLAGEPREEPAPPAGELAADGAAAAAAAPEEEGWCVSVTCADLALRLDMRHPRVVLNLLRFVETYNELAPAGEDIHLPLLPQERADFILAHESVVNPAPEFAAEVAELRALVERFTEAPQEDDDRYSTDSDDSYRDRYIYRPREW